MAILVVSLFSGCSGGELPVANTSGFDYRDVALQFTKALTERDYDRAYAMTSQDYQGRTSVEQLRTAFEAIVPTDWGGDWTCHGGTNDDGMAIASQTVFGLGMGEREYRGRRLQ